ncbi:hypothetical protein M422DRAFT_69916 [Sphaerobolus stellatus SS14]|uniref:Uncharacterized protein n=1 Tax=Sphaerobolus stellatus (strain SS14) TaxID=990650 RepID=A0A0C9UKX6_SPHS4|nr:hypothetical protein M422DRAFT_69916 [Sphaerobolus stellatus SS14]
MSFTPYYNPLSSIPSEPSVAGQIPQRFVPPPPAVAVAPSIPIHIPSTEIINSKPRFTPYQSLIAGLNTRKLHAKPSVTAPIQPQVPVHKLSTEILQEIFQEALRPPCTHGTTLHNDLMLYIKTRRSIGNVCLHWREIFHDTPGAWTTIIFANFIRLFSLPFAVKRAKGRPLDVYFDFLDRHRPLGLPARPFHQYKSTGERIGYSPVEEAEIVMQILESKIHNIRTLHILGAHDATIDHLFPREGRFMGGLQRLVLDLQDGNQWSAQTGKLHAPRLKLLEASKEAYAFLPLLTNESMKGINHIVFPSLRHHTIQFCKQAVNAKSLIGGISSLWIPRSTGIYSELQRFLMDARSFCSLTHLELSKVLLFNAVPDYFAIQLPALVSMHLRTGRIEDLVSPSSWHLVAPNLSILRLSSFVIRGAAMIKFLSQYPELRHLAFEDTEIFDHEIFFKQLSPGTKKAAICPFLSHILMHDVDNLYELYKYLETFLKRWAHSLNAYEGKPRLPAVYLSGSTSEPKPAIVKRMLDGICSEQSHSVFFGMRARKEFLGAINYPSHLEVEWSPVERT